MSIAQQAGFFWETLWKHSTNTELRDKRKNPCVLLEGDAVNIPEKRPGEASGATGKRHRFRRKGIPAKLRLQFCEDGKPVKSAPWRADVDGRLHHGETDADGTAELPIPANVQRAVIMLGEGEHTRKYELLLGRLDPHDTLSGAQMRLNNLGFAAGPVDGKMSSSTQRAIRQLQRYAGLEVTGDLDEPTRNELKKLHGS